MNIALTHAFLTICHGGKYNLEELCTGNRKISEYVSKLKKQANYHPTRNSPAKFIGDGFEMLIEALIKLSPVDNRLGISDYKNAPYDEAGIDGYGIGSNGRPAAVQIKFKSDHEYLLTETKDNMAGFLSVAQSSDYDVIRDDFSTNLLVITYGEGLHHKTIEQFFRDGVKVIGRDGLRNMVDNNVVFWDKFVELTKPYF